MILEKYFSSLINLESNSWGVNWRIRLEIKGQFQSTFTKLKAVWEELKDFLPNCSCEYKCGGHKALEEFVREEYVMAFLMRLKKVVQADEWINHTHGSFSSD